MGTKKEIEDQVDQLILEKKERVDYILNHCDLIDDDGYPTDEALEAIENWHWDDIPGWFEFVGGLWSYQDRVRYFYREHDWKKETNKHLSLSTGGWSGNESIIHAMRHNSLMWSLTWYMSKRGGYHEFQVTGVLG